MTSQENEIQAGREQLSAGAPPDYFVSFARALNDAQGGLFDWLYFLDKPQKWAREYVAWESFGRPQVGDDGWTEFVEWVDAND